MLIPLEDVSSKVYFLDTAKGFGTVPLFKSFVIVFLFLSYKTFTSSFRDFCFNCMTCSYTNFVLAR